MPILEGRGFISAENGSHEVLVPCLNHKQHQRFCAITKKAATAFAEELKEPLAEYRKHYRKDIPSHLTGVPEDKLTTPYEPGAMMFVYEAIQKGVHPRDLGCPCPETIAVFD